MKRLLPAVLAAVLLLAGPGAGAQEEVRVDEVDVSDHPRVRLLVTAPGSLAGTDVSAGFLVEEDGEPRPTAAEALTSEPLEVMLVVDTSGSMRGDPLIAAKEAARQFVERMPPTTRLGVIGFGSTVGETLPFTEDRAAVTAALDALRATGETALYDALVAAAAGFDRSHSARRFVVLLSDGGDTASGAGLADTAAALAGTDIELYVVALSTPESDPAAMEELSDRVIPATDADALAGAYDEIADELVSQYWVVYESASHDATEIRVSVAHGDVVATTMLTIDLPANPATTITTTTKAASAAPTTAPTTAPEAVPMAASALHRFTGPGPGFFGSARAVGIGFVAIFVALVVLLIPAFATNGSHRRLAEGTRMAGGVLSSAIGTVSGRAESLAARMLRRRGRDTALNHALDAAGIVLRPGEFVVLLGCGVLVGFAVGSILGGWLLGLVLAVSSLGMAFGLLRMRTDRRRLAFSDQLQGTLQLIAGSLRAGYGLMQAVNTVAAESAVPTSDEFERIVMETRLGRDLTDSLEALSTRMGNEDFGWVVQAIRIQREVGGDLAELLDTVTSTIRDRHQVHRQVRALSAEGRLSAVVLILLPIGLAGVIMITNPGYLSVLFETTVGKVLIVVGLALMAIGTVWIRRITNLTF